MSVSQMGFLRTRESILCAISSASCVLLSCSDLSSSPIYPSAKETISVTFPVTGDLHKRSPFLRSHTKNVLRAWGIFTVSSGPSSSLNYWLSAELTYGNKHAVFTSGIVLLVNYWSNLKSSSPSRDPNNEDLKNIQDTIDILATLESR